MRWPLALLLLTGCVDKIPDKDRDGVAEADGDCDDADPTRFPGAVELCDGVDQNCNNRIDEVDADGDGYGACSGDCNDDSVDVFPGNTEVCDGVDNDCSGEADEGFDADGDGFAPCFGDCDDDNAARHPDAPEACNAVDDDCDTFVDEDFDQDGDGYRSCDSPADCDDSAAQIHPGASEGCDGRDWDCDGSPGTIDTDGDGYSPCLGDCDDDNSARAPGRLEVCDNVDNNCNNAVDEGFDLDQDGAAVCAGDCDDHNANIGPTATEVCDGLDNDCSDEVDEDFDQDGDGFSTCAEPVADCDDFDFLVRPDATETCNGKDDDCDGARDEDWDIDGDDWAACVGDCDESNPFVHPDATELCNEVDDDCDTLVDEGFDADSDTFAVCDGDCDDNDPSVRPGATEVCDGADNDCDGTPDDDFDQDGDTATTCGPDGVPGTADDDCDDTDSNVFPGAIELACDGKDTDCNGFVLPAERDLDGDSQPSCAGDCDDSDPLRFLGNPEVCDLADNDCNFVADEGFDADGDGVYTCGPDGVPGTADDDCDDGDPGNAPTLTESCDLADNDCDGQIDDGFDLDGDLVFTCGPDGAPGTADDDCDDADPLSYPGAAQDCTAADRDCDGVPGNLDFDGDGSFNCEDCDDADGSVHPGAGFTTCDGTDHDCDGVAESALRVAFLPGQWPTWSTRPALTDLVAESAGFPGCHLEFVDIAAPVTEAALDASAAHVALLSSPGENCTIYDGAARDELAAWLLGNGRGLVITGTLGTDACVSYSARYELATLAGVTLNSTDPSTPRVPTIARNGSAFWTGIVGFSYSSSASTQGDSVLSLCTGAVVEGLVGNAGMETPRQIVRYQASLTAPCLSGSPQDHRGAWLPLQPEENGNATDRRLLYNALSWVAARP